MMENAKTNVIRVMMEAALKDGKRAFRMRTIIGICVSLTAAFIGAIKIHIRFAMGNVCGLQKDFAMVKIIMMNTSIITIITTMNIRFGFE